MCSRANMDQEEGLGVSVGGGRGVSRVGQST